MDSSPTIHGSCACGRNRYAAEVPESRASILFDSSSATRRHQASPFAAWLRIPLTHFQSATYALFPDETHASIRRTFESPAAPDKRIFCGYCGTQLSRWSEASSDDADFISLTLGSINDGDLALLEELGLFPEEDTNAEADSALADQRRGVQDRHVQRVVGRGAPWFDAMVEDSPLGRIRRQKGAHASRDGTSRVEWEVVEFTSAGDDGAEAPSGKRKLEDMGDRDVESRT